MIQEYSKYKVLKVFLNSPTHNFKVREISRLIGLAPTSTKLHLDALEKSGLVKKVKEKNYELYLYQANRENPKFSFWQQQAAIFDLHYSGLIEYLWDQLSPEVIILYGSHAKGEAIESSDIDLFIIGKEKPINIEKYEKLLNKKPHLEFAKEFDRLPKELKNNLINGKILKGYIKIFK